MKLAHKGLAATALAFFLCSCSNQTSESASTSAAEDTQSFKNAFADDFLIGAAISKDQIEGDKKIKGFIAKHFNALTAENEMKWEKIQPKEGEFNWSTTDTLVDYAQKNNIHITGHALLWHQQAPEWIFLDETGGVASRELVLSRLKTHIFAMMTRYKGKVPSWDVVNEALNEDGSMRQSKWLHTVGEDYVLKAFEYAHEADPNAKLYYNDYNMFKPEKRDGAVRLVKQIQDAGVPVHGIGMQAHYGTGYPSDLSQVEDAIVAFGKLGEVLVTELDISVLPFPDEESMGADISLDFELNNKYNPYVDGLPDDAQAAQDEHYLNLFDIYLKHKDKISRVTFWGVDDGQSWRNYWPMQGRTDYPLMIDRDFKLKPVTTTLFERARSN